MKWYELSAAVLLALTVHDWFLITERNYFGWRLLALPLRLLRHRLRRQRCDCGHEERHHAGASPSATGFCLLDCSCERFRIDGRVRP